MQALRFRLQDNCTIQSLICKYKGRLPGKKSTASRRIPLKLRKSRNLFLVMSVFTYEVPVQPADDARSRTLDLDCFYAVRRHVGLHEVQVLPGVPPELEPVEQAARVRIVLVDLVDSHDRDRSV